MSEEGTAVLERTEEERSPGGLFTKTQFDVLMGDIDKLAASRDEVPPDAEQAAPAAQAAEPSPEPEEAKSADEPSREPEPVDPEPVASEPTEPEVPEPAEPAESKADEESPAAEFDDQLLARAEQMGFSKQAAQSFGTPDNLERSLTALDRRLMGFDAAKREVAPQVAEPAPVVPAPLVQPQPAQASQQTIDALTIDLNEDDHDPAIVEQFKKLNNHYEARAAQFEQAFVGLLTAMQSGQKQSEDRIVNEAIDGLDDKLKNLITPEVRLQIKPLAITLADNLRQSRLPVPSPRELVKRAAQGLLSEQLLETEHKRATEEISAKLERRAAQRTSRPSQHRSEEPGMTAEEKRKQSVKDIQAHIDKSNLR